LSFEKHYEWAKKRLEKIETTKKQVILKLAEKLEKSGMVVETICANISSNLANEGYVTDRYVREVLEDTKYKRKYENKDMIDIGTSSESQQSQENEQKQNVVVVDNTGKHTPKEYWKPRQKEEEKLARVSDLVGLERAIYDRDEKIKELRTKNEELHKQVVSMDTVQEIQNGESKLVENLKSQLESANTEIDYLKEQRNIGVVNITPTLYSKLKTMVTTAIRNNLSSIRIEYHGDEATNIGTI
jgi:hypothetical protein